MRDSLTGQYAFDGGLERLCRCGHALGLHLAGGFDCINADVGERKPCDCPKFRPQTHTSKEG